MLGNIYNRLTSRQMLRYLALAILLVISIVIIAAKLQRPHYIRSIDATIQHIKTVRDGITAVQTPETIELGQKDLSVQHIIDQLKTLEQTNQDSVLPSPIVVCAAMLPRLSCGDYRQLSRESDKSLRQGYALITYHEQVMTSLKPLLEYNPEADLGDERLNQPTIDTRIDNARQGLTKVLTGLNTTNGSIADTSKSDLEAAVKRLQGELETFDKNRNKSTWYQSVSKAQEAIIINRQKFWLDSSVARYLLLDQANSDITEFSAEFTN